MCCSIKSTGFYNVKEFALRNLHKEIPLANRAVVTDQNHTITRYAVFQHIFEKPVVILDIACFNKGQFLGNTCISNYTFDMDHVGEFHVMPYVDPKVVPDYIAPELIGFHFQNRLTTFYVAANNATTDLNISYLELILPDYD